MDESTFRHAVGFVRGIFEGNADGHDFHHTIRVHDLAVAIAGREGGDIGIIRLAALLHDVDDSKLFATHGLENARRFMESEAIPEEVRERVCDIISQIPYGGNPVVPNSLEGKIVQDADRLDAIGAVGIARAFAFGGSRGRPMHIPDRSFREDMTESEYRGNEGTTINHFHEKLLRLRDMMNTDTAREMAEARHGFMLLFLEEFDAEWRGEK